MEHQNKYWLFKDWTIYPTLNLIQNHQSEVVLKPRLMKLLDFFLIHQNEVVTREAILEFVWEDRIVTENLLTKSISELRKTLEDHFAGDLKIETIRNVGYRFQAHSDIQKHTNKPTELIKKKDRKRNLMLPLLLLIGGFVAIAAFTFFSKKTNREYQADISIISSLKGQEITPVVSPDGQNLAFGWRASTIDPFHVYVRSLKENTARKLTRFDDSEFNPAWSPDGQYIAFMRRDSNRHLTLVQKSVIGRDEVILAKLDGFQMERSLIWHASSNSLIFAAKKADDPTFRLYEFDLGSTKINAVTHPPAGIYGDIHPAIDKEKGKLVFVRAEGGKSILSDFAPINCSILSVDLQTLETQSVAQFDHEVTALAYHPELEQYLCWSVEELSCNFLWIFDGQGKKQLIESNIGGIAGKGAIGGDQVFYFENWRSGLNVLEYGLKQDTLFIPQPKEYLNSTRWDWGLRFARQANQIAFISLRTGYQEVWIAPSDSPEMARQVTQLKSKFIQSLSLSPDGQSLLFLAIEGDQSALYFVQANGQNLQKISVDGFEYSSPEWSADGKSFFYGSNKSGAWNLWQQEIASHQEWQLTYEGGHTSFLDPQDANRLFFIKNPADTIWQLSLHDKSINPVFATPEMGLFNWAPHKKGIYYLAWEKGICHLYFFSFETSKRIKLHSLEHILPGIPAIAVPPDGGSIYISESDEINADIFALEITF